jgi:hypothetical protein
LRRQVAEHFDRRRHAYAETSGEYHG